MALKLLTSSTTLSSGLNWVQAEYVQLSFGNSVTALNNVVTQAVTFSNAGNQLGIYLFLRPASTLTSGTLTIKLQENTGSWVDRTTDTFSIDSTNYPACVINCYFPLTSYAVTTASSTWRYSVQYSNNSLAWWYSSGPTYTMAVFLDYSTSKPASGDSIIIADNQTLTFDENASWASCRLGMNATFQWENTPATSYTLTQSSSGTATAFFQFGSSGSVLIGSSDNPIPVDKKAIIDLSSYPGNALFHGVAYYYMKSPYTPPRVNFRFEFYGSYSTNMYARISALASAGQKNIVTTTDKSSVWQIGDQVTLYGKKRTGNADTVTYTISDISNTTITLNTNLDYDLLAGGAITNLSEAIRTLGISIEGNSGSSGQSTLASSTEGFSARQVMSGCLFKNFHAYAPNMFIISSSLGISYYEHIMSYTTGLATVGLVNIGCLNTSVAGTYIDDCHRYSGSLSSTPSSCAIRGGSNVRISNVCLKNSTNEGGGQVAVINASTVTLSGIVSCSHVGNYYNQGSFRLVNDTNVTASDLFLIGSYETLFLSNVINATINNAVANGAIGSSYGRNLHISSVVKVTFNDSKFGDQIPSVYADIVTVSETYNEVLFNNCIVGQKGINGTKDMVPGSYLGFINYGTTANNHKTWWKYGTTQSVGDGLADTTVHTPGIDKFAIRFEPTNSEDRLFWRFPVPVGNIQNKTMTVAVWCKINSSTYYSGVHQNPRLTINYDNGTEIYREASNSTDWQLLSVTFTPTTSYGQIEVTLSGRTDATGSNSYFYFDDFAVLYPAGYKLDLGGFDLWANALPITPPIATVLSPYDVWTVPTSTVTGDGTIGKKLATLKNMKFIADGQIPIY